MIQDRPTLGIALMLSFCILAPVADSIAKLIGHRVDIGILVAIRFLVQMLILAPLVYFGGTRLRYDRRVMALVFARTLLHIAGIGTMFMALRFLPLADAVAIAFVMPFIMLILGNFFLGEAVGMRRILACCVGFAGTLMVVQPSFAEVGAPALLPLAVAVIFAFFILVTRQIAKDIDPVALQAVSGAMAVAIMLPVVLVAQPFDIPGLQWRDPAGSVWLLLLLLGVLGTVAHLLMTWSLRFAPSTTLAPMQYLEIPVAALVGWLVFGDFPNGLALVGIMVTIAAGLYVLHREHAVSKLERATPPPAPPAA